MNYPLEPIAIIHSPFKEKFATPRQPGLVPSVTARIEFLPELITPEAVRELEGFSHIWLIFLFHHNWQQGWQPTVRPPRLGGNQRVGVFASRSPFRPNPIGLSAVRLISIDYAGGRVELTVQGADLIDGTPILDIKPYLPYSDSITEATGGFAGRTPEAGLQVEFSEPARRQLADYSTRTPALKDLIIETLSLDPRPAYRQQQEDRREYGVLLDQFNLRWRVEGKRVVVVSIEPGQKSLQDHPR